MQTSRSRLLIVDDEPATRELLSMIFAARGHSVAIASDGFSALEQIKHDPPDIILSDLNMPGMSGFELLSVVRRRLPKIFVIATSGAYVGNAIPNGIAADAFYQKATGLKALFEAVQRAARAEHDEPRPTLPVAPVWLSSDLIGDNNIVLACPECLRTFPHAQSFNGTLVRQVACPHCAAEIDYAIVDLLAPVSEQVYQNELNSALPAAPVRDQVQQG